MSNDGNPASVFSDEDALRYGRNKEAAKRVVPVSEGDLTATVSFIYDPSATMQDRAEILALLKSHPKVLQAELMTRNPVKTGLPSGEVIKLDVRSQITYSAAPTP